MKSEDVRLGMVARMTTHYAMLRKGDLVIVLEKENDQLFVVKSLTEPSSTEVMYPKRFEPI